MRGCALLAALLCAAIGAGAEARAAESSVAKDLEDCIRRNAANVEAAIADLDKASRFLISDVCAIESSAAMQAAGMRASAKRAARKDKCETEYIAKSKADSKSGRSATLACFDVMDSVIDITVPPAATAFAARLLLDLRTKRLEREGRQP